jgi:hypothetical protein
MNLDSAKLKVASYLSSLVSTTSAENSKYVVLVNVKQRSLKCEKIFYLIILYCLDFYNELSEEFKYRIQEIVNELPEPNELTVSEGTDEVIEIPEEYQCLGITVLEYFLTNIDGVLEDCNSKCFCSNNVINCFITFMVAINLILNHREKEGNLLIKFIKGQLSNIYRDGVEYENTFYLTEDQELYGFIKCHYDRCYVDTDNDDTMLELIVPDSLDFELQNEELYGNR